MGIITISIIISLFLLTILYYYNYISDSTYSFLKILIVLIIIFIGSFRLGNMAINKGYMEGVKISLLIVLLLLSITIIFSNFQIKLLLYYTMIISTSILGSTSGIYKKRSSKSRTS